MKTLNEEINRIKDIMLINEIGGGSLEDFRDMSFKKNREENPHMSKKYNPESETDFPNSKVTDVVWRAGGLDDFHQGGGIWFGESKEDVEKFVRSVRGEERQGKPYHINLENPYYFDSFWHGYVNAAESKGHRGGRERLMHDLVRQGYDGIIIGEDMWNDTADPETQVWSKQYIVFNPENIKPA